MSIWPYWPVWPFLVALGLVTIFRSPAVGVAVVVQVLLVQAVKWWGPESAQYLYFALYSTAALILAVFFDRLGGFVFATIAVTYAAFLAGVIGQYPKLIFAEVAMFAGVAIANFTGPTGGLLDRLHSLPANRSGDIALHRTLHVESGSQAGGMDQESR